MTIEERLKRYADKGELVHLSLAFHGGQYHAKLALASPAGGYASAEDKDPIKALEDVFAATPVKVRAKPAVTATVKARDGIEAQHGLNDVFPGDEVEVTLPNDWTTP